ncbi:conserved hypothetical protein [Herminiimonas arsenicoxydans]|uniref:Uncharacterized protein n=1 Tax=Herminiimonas arsenicoxydans TaxID=204773 RepID=A4G2P7_HERAR|nr:conserved hypothetical protein [Herminiimonas arsenicoxydans]
MSHDQTLHLLQDSLHAIRQNRLAIADFCQSWRTQTALLSALPPRYAEVMEDLLGRLEAGSLFTEESCSFSQVDLLANLDLWLDKAQQTLAKIA